MLPSRRLLWIASQSSQHLVKSEISWLTCCLKAVVGDISVEVFGREKLVYLYVEVMWTLCEYCLIERLR